VVLAGHDLLALVRPADRLLARHGLARGQRAGFVLPRQRIVRHDENDARRGMQST
jgi:hypothetical protein